MLRHLYVAFWRPDILAKFIADDTKTTGVCDYVGPAKQFSTTLADVTCGACRESFLAALPTGNGVKTTWREYLAQEAARPAVLTIKDRAAELDKREAEWMTANTPKTPEEAAQQWDGPRPVWETTPAPKAPADVWTTNPDGWSSGLPATGPGWSSDWTTKP